MLQKALDELRALYPNVQDLIAALSQVCGRGQDEMEEEIAFHISLRTLFLLLGHVESAPNYRAAQHRLARCLGHSEADLHALSAAIANVRLSLRGAEGATQAGVADLSYVERQRLLRRQGSRCAVCGWPFESSDMEHRSPQQAQVTLDHVIPFRLGGDGFPNLRLVCGLCNSIKQAKLHVGEQGLVWTNNYIYWPRRKTVAFWTFERDLGCRVSDCTIGPATGRLFAVRRGDRGPWSFDNCTTVCETHADGLQFVEY
jgi:hypothetical protein